jgi:RNA polymerase sigma factor (sigma-70 family)
MTKLGAAMDGQDERPAPALSREAWDATVREHNHRVVLSLLGLGLSPDRAQELAQNTWFTLFEKHGAGTLDQLRFPGLAITQARFLALDALRKDRTARRRLESIDTKLRDDHATPEQITLGREQLARAIRELADLHPSAQQVFRLAYGENLSHSVIAERLGLSLQRVRQIVCETRRRLRASLEQT